MQDKSTTIDQTATTLLSLREALRLIWLADKYPCPGNEDWATADRLDREALERARHAVSSPGDHPEFAAWLAALQNRDLPGSEREQIMFALHDLFGPEDAAARGRQQLISEYPWILVPEKFGPACIGGWSAAEHWGLTDQIFRSICVLTTRKVDEVEQAVEGVPFSVKHIPQAALFATRRIWHGSVAIDISNPAKTIIDMLDDPAIGCGIRHVAECLIGYFKRADASSEELLATGDQLGNRFVFNRLGFLAERVVGQQELAAACRTRLFDESAPLDPSVPGRHLVAPWRLWVAPSWEQGPS